MSIITQKWDKCNNSLIRGRPFFDRKRTLVRIFHTFFHKNGQNRSRTRLCQGWRLSRVISRHRRRRRAASLTLTVYLGIMVSWVGLPAAAGGPALDRQPAAARSPARDCRRQRQARTGRSTADPAAGLRGHHCGRQGKARLRVARASWREMGARANRRRREPEPRARQAAGRSTNSPHEQPRLGASAHAARSPSRPAAGVSPRFPVAPWPS